MKYLRVFVIDLNAFFWYFCHLNSQLHERRYFENSANFRYALKVSTVHIMTHRQMHASRSESCICKIIRKV